MPLPRESAGREISGPLKRLSPWARTESDEAFASCEWRYIAMLNFAVTPQLLSPYLPAGTELDLYEGKPWLSLVALTFKNTKALGITVPFQQDYEQVNLRFCVRRTEGGDSRRGVVFLKEIVPKPFLAMAARVFYNACYVAMPTQRKFLLRGNSIQAHYSWGNPEAENAIDGLTEGDFVPLVAGSHEEFISHRLWGYTTQKNGQTSELHVEHPRWLVSRFREANVTLRNIEPFPAEFREVLRRKPDTAFLAEGSHVTLCASHRLPDGPPKH